MAKAKIGTEVAKIFPGWGLYVGQVVDIQTHPDGNFWRIKYEDGEEEDMDEAEVQAGQLLMSDARVEIRHQVGQSQAYLKHKQQGGGPSGAAGGMVGQEVMVDEDENSDEVSLAPLMGGRGWRVCSDDVI